MKLWALVLVCLITFGAGGCTRRRDQVPDDVVGLFRFHIDNHAYHEAFLIAPAVLEELKDVDEDAAGHEYSLLLGTTAGMGRRDWQKIAEDPSIPLEYKRDLIDEIHEDAVKTR